MPDNSQGNVLTYKNLSVYYKVLVMKIYDAEIRIEKYTHITEKNIKMMVILCIHYIL